MNGNKKAFSTFDQNILVSRIKYYQFQFTINKDFLATIEFDKKLYLEGFYGKLFNETFTEQKRKY